MSGHQPRIVIVGGGIGGMSLAVSLHAAGLTDVEIHESASATHELGVGIDVLPHATRELAELGLLDELAALAVEPTELVMFSRLGQRIFAERRGRAAGYRWPQLSIHRGRLLGVLHRAVRERLGEERVHHAHHLDRVTTSDGTACARFVDRRTGRVAAEVEADVVVGCDGVHSAVRAALVPGEGPPVWNGITMWRGVTEAEPFLSGRAMAMAGHSGRRIVASPITAAAPDGRVLVSWIAELGVPGARPMPPEDWNHRVDTDEVIRAFEDFRFDFLDVPSVIGAATSVFQYPMVDRDPLDRWTDGRVTLLGDAAHPMHPGGSNGASQAIIDGRVLARHLALAGSVDEALELYEADRRPATTKVVLANRELGSERCMEIVQERAPDGFTRIEDVFAPGELSKIAENYKATAGFAVHALNKRPSLSVEPVVAPLCASL